MHEPFKNETYHGKNVFLISLGNDFVAAKSGRRRKKHPVLGPDNYCCTNFVIRNVMCSFLTSKIVF